MTIIRPFGGRVAALAALAFGALCIAGFKSQPTATPAQTPRPAARTINPVAQPADRSVAADAPFADEINRFIEWDAKNSFPQDAILFVGSSTIRMWHTRESFPHWPVINRGFGGSTIPDLNRYFKHVVEPYKPRAIVFYSGDNDIASGRTPEQIRDDFAAFIKLVRSAGPKTPVVFLTIKPSGSRWRFWPDMQRANAMIRELLRSDPAATVVDVATPLLDENGALRGELYREDRLHLNEAGYAVWNRVLEPVIERLLAGK